MKKNRTMRIAVLMLALSLLTCCFVGSTFAKYTSSATGTSTVSVAKWDIKYNNATITTVGSDESITFGLFTTIYDTADVDSDPNTDDTDDEVKTGMIAPGTRGSFSYTLSNNSEVAATYTIAYTINKTITADLDGDSNNETYVVPVKFSTDGGSTWADTIEGATATLAIGAADVEVEIMWKWDFTGDDVLDTNIGLAAQTTANEVSVTLDIDVTQVD